MAPHSDVNGLLQRHGCAQIRKVGEGSFGKALLVQNSGGERLICKMVDVGKATKKETDDAVKEARILSELHHPFIVCYRESFVENGWLCILMDYCEGGDLAAQISKARRSRESLKEDQIIKWFTQGILALQYTHQKHILHRDLKPGNFFISGGVMKMGDFGIAKVLACTVAVAKTQIGTPYYLSPELCKEKPYTWPSDIWAMGCILYELCALKVPFDGANIPGLVKKICNDPTPTIPSNYSHFIRDLCKDMLQKNPDSRPSTEKILGMVQIAPLAKELMEAHLEPEAPNKEAAIAQPAPSASEDAGEGSYASHAGNYRKDDLVDYLSTAHKSWLPAKILNTKPDGSIIIDLKPNTWIPVSDQVTKVRPRRGAAHAAPVAPPSPVPPNRVASPMKRSPSGGRDAAPNSEQVVPQSGVRAASPRLSVQGAQPAAPSAGGGNLAYQIGDLVEYLSSSHKEWLPAIVMKINPQGAIAIDLKPNTWMTKDEQASKIRRRAAPQPPRMAGSPAGANGSVRDGSPMRRNSSVDRASNNGVARRTPSPSPMRARGGTPSPMR